MVTKDDPELKFDDDVDDNMLAAMVPDPVTWSNPSCATSTATANPVLSLPRTSETGTVVTEARASTSRVTTNPRQELPHTLITGSTTAQAHATTSSVTTTPVRSVPLDTESGPTATQASQMPPQPPQPQVNTDHSSGQSGHIPDAGTCF